MSDKAGLCVRESTETCGCNNCFARNYDSKISVGERVDVIYEVKIGTMVNGLCPECLKKLHSLIGEMLGDQQTVF